MKNHLVRATGLLLCFSAPCALAVPSLDTDADTIVDARDNCLLVANINQRDTDNDGFGNACDMDLNNDGIINAVDLGAFRAVFFSADPDADADGDGVVNILDLGVMRDSFFRPPGPTQFVTWIAPSGGDWSEVSNWRPARVPTTGDHVLITTPILERVTATALDNLQLGSLTLEGDLTLDTGSTLAIAGDVVVDLTRELRLQNSTLSAAAGISGQGSLFLSDATIQDSPIAVPFIESNSATTNILRNVALRDLELHIEEWSSLHFTGSLVLDDVRVEIDTGQSTPPQPGLITELSTEAMTSFAAAGFNRIALRGDAPPAAVQLRLVSNSGANILTFGVALDIEFGAATLAENPTSTNPLAIETGVFVDGFGVQDAPTGLVIDAPNVLIDFLLDCRANALRFGPNVQTVQITAQGSLATQDCDVDFPDGLINNGTMWLRNTTGRLGSFSGVGAFACDACDLRLTGQHKASALADLDDGNSHFLLDGIIDGQLEGTTTYERISFRTGAWSFAPESRVQSVELDFDPSFELPANQTLTLANVDFSLSQIDVAPGAVLVLEEQITGVGFANANVVLQSPSSTAQPQPALRFGGQFVTLGDSMIFEVESALAPGLSPAVIANETLTELLIGRDVTFRVLRSTQFVNSAQEPIINEGQFDFDGAPSLAGDPVVSEFIGGLVNESEGELLVRNGAVLNIVEDWSNFGNVNVSGQSEFRFVLPQSNNNIAFTDATAIVEGPFDLFDLGALTLDETSTLLFRGFLNASLGQSFDTDVLPDSFRLDSGAVIADVAVVGATPLRALGGMLDNVSLLTDLIIDNGATVDVKDLQIDGRNIVLSADDQVTTLRIDAPGSIDGSDANLVFAGTTTSDQLNVVEMNSLLGPFGSDFSNQVVATSAGGILRGVPNETLINNAALNLDAPGRSVTIDVGTIGELEQLGDVSLATGSTLNVVGALQLAGVDLDFEVSGLNEFGRIIGDSTSAFDIANVSLEARFTGGYLPNQCDQFALADNFFFSSTDFSSVSATGVDGLNVAVEIDSGALQLTVFDQPTCD